MARMKILSDADFNAHPPEAMNANRFLWGLTRARSQYNRNHPSLAVRCLDAARAMDIPEGHSGRWYVKRLRLLKDQTVRMEDWKMRFVPTGVYTQLFNLTLATQHKIGELVMHDFPDELNTHLDFMVKARGRVLITGLGLGCVVRGCLANPAVDSITVIERDPHVLKLVAPFMPMEKLTIIEADAIKWCRTFAKRKIDRFNCAWHDLWSDPDKGEGHLQLAHSKLLKVLARVTDMQGAWQMPREHRRLWRQIIDIL